jgi:hypothetical protein
MTAAGEFPNGCCAALMSSVWQQVRDLAKIIWVLACVAEPVFAHGGGLNAEGCHNNRKTGEYHCHRGGESSASRQMDRAPPQGNGNANAGAQNRGRPTCYTGPRGGTYTITKSGRKDYKGC